MPLREILAGGRGGAVSERALADPSDLAVKGAAVAMVLRELVKLLDQLSIEEIAEALRDAAPEAAVASLLADVALLTQKVTADDPIIEAMKEGARRKREMLEEAGGWLSSEAVAKQLGGISRQAVDKRRAAGTLLAVPLPNGDWAYPVAQFQPDGRPLEGMSDALRAFRIRDPWMKLDQFLSKDLAFEGRSAFDLLRLEGVDALPRVRGRFSMVGEQQADEESNDQAAA